MLQIINENAPKVKLNRVLVKNTIENHYASKRKTPDSQRFKSLLIAAMFLAVDPQLKSGTSFKLDLSDNFLSKRLDVTTNQATRIRAELKSAGLIFFPEWSRPKKEGDYPCWLVKHEYMTFMETEKVKRAVVNRKYQPLYYVVKDDAQREVYSMLSEYDAVITMKVFMQLVYKTLDEKLAELGIEKAQLLR